jgi:RHS repeat-associated protein
LVASVGTTRLGHDGLGSVVQRVGGATAASQYDAWGQYSGGSPVVGDVTPGFAGQSWDSDSGLSYAQQRWMAPALGRFLSEDPVGVTPERLLAVRELNGFGYAGGNPGRWRDPDGRIIPLLIVGGVLVWEALTIREEVAGGKGLTESSDAVMRKSMQHFADQGYSAAQQSGSTAAGLATATGGQFATQTLFALPNLVLHPVDSARGIVKLPVGALSGAYGAITTTGEERLANIGKMAGGVGGTLAVVAGAGEGLQSIAEKRVATLPEMDSYSTASGIAELANLTSGDIEGLAAQRVALLSLLHKRELGLDPAIGKFRPQEARVGSELEARLGVQLKRATRGADWVDPATKTTYDLVGPVPNEHFSLPDFTKQIDRHFLKADRPVVDLRGLSEENVAGVDRYINGLPKASSERLIVLR